MEIKNIFLKEKFTFFRGLSSITTYMDNGVEKKKMKLLDRKRRIQRSFVIVWELTDISQMQREEDED